MTVEMLLVFALTGVVFLLFATERVRTDLLALSVLSVLGLLGLITPDELLSCFSNPAPITVAAMFVLGAGLTRTGALEGVANRLLLLADKGEAVLVLALMSFVALTSAFINNTAVVTFFLPVVLHLCAQKQIPPSRLLIPLSFAAMLGGTCTLIGTSTNIVVSNVAARLGEAPLRMFEQTPFGLVLTVLGVTYVVVLGRRFLPVRETLMTLLAGSAGKEFRTEVVVLRNSPLVGRTLGEVRGRSLRGGTVLGLIRDHQPLDPPFDSVVLRSGDRILLNIPASGVRDVQAQRGLALLPEGELGVEELTAEQTSLVEAIVPLNSPLQGRSLGELDLSRHHAIRVLAVHRHGLNLQDRFDRLPLRFGDTLLLQGTDEALQNLRQQGELLLLSPVKIPLVRRHKSRMAVAIVAGVMLLASLGPLHLGGFTLGPFPVATVAIIGSLLLVLTRCLEMNEAYEAINWNIVMLIVGMLGLGLALEKTGGAAFVAGQLTNGLGAYGPHATLAGIYLVSMILTEIVSNNAVAALMTPIALATAQALDCDPRPFLLAVVFAASASFSTPIGYQTNTMVYGAGGYKFTDFLKIGAPMNCLFWLVATLLLPWFWPLR